MANQNVRFFFTDDKSKFDALAPKNPLALYFIEDTEIGYRALYKGDNLIAVGSNASATAAGLLSAEDYGKLQNLISGGSTSALTPADSTIKIADGAIGVQVSAKGDNLIRVEDDGLYVIVDALPVEKITGLESRLEAYLSKAEMNAVVQRVKYDVFSKPVGTTVKIMDNEIRICCASNTEWKEQNVGPTGNADNYYVGLKIYAPIGSDHFMEDLNKTIEDETVFDFTDDFSGRDAYGNGYSIVWLPVAVKQADGTWKYYGDDSTEDRMIGWYYTSAFYDDSNNLLSKETIRISLMNDSMSTEIKPYYMSNYVTDAELDTAISEAGTAATWSQL